MQLQDLYRSTLAENRQDMVDSLLGLVFKLYFIGDCIVLISLSII